MSEFDYYSNNLTSEKKCSKCGTSLTDFLYNGIAGCAYCYESFKDEARNFLLQKQGSFNHQGKISSKHFSKIKIAEQIEKLEIEKNQAIKDENFILAEALKNQIEKLKGEL